MKIACLGRLFNQEYKAATKEIVSLKLLAENQLRAVGNVVA